MRIESLGIKLGATIECGCGRMHHVYTKKMILKDNAIIMVPRLIDELGFCGKGVIVDDEVTRSIAGLKLIELLRNEDFFIEEYVMSRPTISEVMKLANTLSKASFAIAVGGGSVIDTCKLASHKNNIPFISVPTALSHDGVTSASASIMSESGVKETHIASPPIAVVFDLSILRTQPRRMIASGCGDMMSKATSIKDWELGRNDIGEYYCPTVAKLSLMTFDETISFIQSGGKDIEGFSQAIFQSGIAMAMMGSTRPNSGSEHIISHYIDMRSSRPAMHGEQVGVATILMSLYHSKYNENWWSEEKYQWYYIKAMLEKIQAPVTIESLGVELDILIEALTSGYKIRPNRYTILHKRPITKDEATSLLKITKMY